MCEGAYVRSKACVREKMGLSAEGLYERGPIGAETWYIKNDYYMI